MKNLNKRFNKKFKRFAKGIEINRSSSVNFDIKVNYERNLLRAFSDRKVIEVEAKKVTADVVDSFLTAAQIRLQMKGVLTMLVCSNGVIFDLNANSEGNIMGSNPVGEDIVIPESSAIDGINHFVAQFAAI